MKNLLLLFSILTTLTSFGQDLNNGLIAYYPLNNSVIDETGNHNGISYNLTPTNDKDGNENSCFYFNGYNSYIDLKDNFLSTSNFTVSLWFKTDYSGHINTLVSTRHSDNTFSHTIVIENNKLELSLDGPGYFKLFKGDKNVNDNSWHFVTVIKNSSNYRVMLDGIEISSGSGNISANNSSIHIGHHGAWNNFFNGSIDEVRFYNRVLSDNEILELYRGVPAYVSQSIQNQTSVNIYESIKKFDCYTSVIPEIFNLKSQELILLKLSDNIISLVSIKDWTEKKKIKNEEDKKIKLSSSYVEGNDLYIALYNQKKNEIPYYLKLNLSTLETDKIKCSKTDRGCIISSASSDYIKPERNKPYKLNENVIFFRNDGSQYYYEVSKIVEEKEDYSKALNGNYKDKVNFLKKYQNSTYSKEVEKKLFDNLKSIKEVAIFSKENSDYNEKSVTRSYEIAKSTKSKTELNDFINNFSSSKFASEIKAKLNTIENEEEQQRIANEKARIQREKEEQDRQIAEQKENERKLAEQKKKELEYQKYLANKEKERVNRIKNAREGDKICYVQNRVKVYDDRDYFFGFVISGSRQEVNYSMKVICFVEKNAGDRLQVRVGTVSSSNKNEYATPVIDGVEYQKGDILWIKPLKDDNWFFED